MDKRATRRFLKNRGALVGAVMVAMVLAIALLGPWFAPHDPNVQFRDVLLHADGTPALFFEAKNHVLGGDVLGRDQLSRLLDGGRVSLQVALFATGLAVFVGTLVGMLAGYFGGLIDTTLMRVVDILLSLPFLLVAIAINRVVDSPSLLALQVLLGLLSWTTLARVTRAKTLQVREMEFVQAARALGANHGRVLLRHVLPNVTGPAIVIGTTLVAQMVIVESAMSYLGIGVKPPQASWGSMLREGQEMLTYAPRLVLLPGLLIVTTVLGFNLVGEGLRDALDPKA